MADLRLLSARPADLAKYLALLEEVDKWLDSKGIRRWESGSARDIENYFAESIDRGEVSLAFLDGNLVGTLRLLPEDPIVWPEIHENDALYVYNLAVGRAWAGRRLGRRILGWAESRTASVGRNYVRLDCFAKNETLRHYYADAGFAERGEVNAEYPPSVGNLRLLRFEKHLLARR